MIGIAGCRNRPSQWGRLEVVKNASNDSPRNKFDRLESAIHADPRYMSCSASSTMVLHASSGLRSSVSRVLMMPLSTSISRGPPSLR